MKYHTMSALLILTTLLLLGWTMQQIDPDEIVASAQKELAAKLKAALDSGGPIAALETCSVEALTTTQKIADQYGVTVRRATLKPRNPYNTANDLERTALLDMESALRTRGVADTMTITADGIVTVLYPIRVVEKPCMACHGTVDKEISSETAAAIAERYPDDKATGYAPGQLRGAWVISYKK